MQTNDRLTILECTTSIVAAYVGNHSIPKEHLPLLIADTFNSLVHIEDVKPEPGKRSPAVPIKQSVQPDHIVCLEDGRKLKSLKRHLKLRYNMSPREYREKWDLPATYPMVAPEYARERSDSARRMGLGRRATPTSPAEEERKKKARSSS